MIDFRYHLVSLISVFLALAVGVVLGAGPLQNSLGTALNDQVSALRADRNSLQTRLETTEQAVNERDSYITSAAEGYLPGTLSNHTVTLLVMPDATKEDVEAVSTDLTTAGATVAGQVSLTSAWADTARATFRETYAGQFGAYLPSSGATGNAILGEGLATALTTSGTGAGALMDLLTASDNPLVTVDSQPSATADMLVVVGPRPVDTTTATQAAATSAATPGTDLTAWTAALGGVAAVSTTVVVGAAASDHDVVSAIRSAGTRVTTVDSIGQAPATVSVPLALASTASGTVAAYGFEAGVDDVIPPLPAAK